jgi:RNA polymerase primary sigma factor
MYNQEDISIYLKDVRQTTQLTKAQEIDLAKRIQKGDRKAEEQLIVSNLRFVISIAKQYQGAGIALPDLINEGNYGLVKAAKRYDLAMGFRFISYAVWWIKQSILQCINDHSRMIRLPVNMSNELLKMRNLTGEELEETMAIAYPKVKSLDGNWNNQSDDRAVNYYETLVDRSIPQPDEQMVRQDMPLKDALDMAMTTLDEREKYIIRSYFLTDDDPKTLETLGTELALTKERVRQIRDKAIRKIRNNSSPLFSFFE